MATRHYERNSWMTSKRSHLFDSNITFKSKFSRKSSAQDEDIETQFKVWADDWDKRVFGNKIAYPKQTCYFYNKTQHQLILALVDEYLHSDQEQIMRDRFAWTCFALGVIKEHKRQSMIELQRKTDDCHEVYYEGGKSEEFCFQSKNTKDRSSLLRCMYVLVWISFYLKLPSRDVVEELIRHIITSTHSLTFFIGLILPGMSLRIYMRFLWSNAQLSLIDEQLSWEFFSLFDTRLEALSSCREVYRLAKPALLYLVNRLSPLHSDRASIKSTAPTLSTIINTPILPDRFPLLIIAVRQNDLDLIQVLLDRGASVNKIYWDAGIEKTISAERLMVSIINDAQGSQQFMARISPQLSQVKDTTVETISAYAPLFWRSVLRSGLKRSSNVWKSEESLYELNTQIADRWGIGHQRPFPSLQHISKIVIREQIKRADNTLLQDATKCLPLPNKLIRYLNLQLD